MSYDSGMPDRPVAIMVCTLGLATGCSSAVHTRSILPPIFASARHVTASGPGTTRAAAPAALVERNLRGRGLRFGTDGTVGALHAYMRDRHRAVDPRAVRPGDVVFFDLGSDGLGCADHVGLVEEVDGRGRATFRELRAGAVRRSQVYAAAPQTRRDAQGRVLNSFLRVKRPEDPAGARYFAGEMLCGVFRSSLP